MQILEMPIKPTIKPKQVALGQAVEVVGNVNILQLFKATNSGFMPGMVLRLVTPDGRKSQVVRVTRCETFTVHPETRAVLLAGRRVAVDELMALAEGSQMRLDEVIEAIHEVGGYPGGAQVVHLAREGGAHGG